MEYEDSMWQTMENGMTLNDRCRGQGEIASDALRALVVGVDADGCTREMKCWCYGDRRDGGE